ncbi:Riboflavin transporter MCH5 [Cytospora mali]|uniref:Riboflavin transporter MCH5 n=1 Tax=Cytospora mali TaxID=578113 RepID=A0A194VAK0_CYTMA|nr:Riboflavin transporter MCH5 [Valsa mali var. pyri (nom. inval.)]
MVEKDVVGENRQGVLSSDSSATIKLDVKGLPNGGLKAWLQILGAFFLYFNTWGMVSSFGSYESDYEDSILANSGSFQISTIGSVQSFLMVFMGFIAGPIFDKGFFSYLLRIGTLLVLVGTITQGLSTDYWQLLLSQGVCVGIGMGCLAVPAVAVPSAWFSTKLPFANGIVVSAGGFGGVVYPIMIRSLIPLIGFKYTSLSVALIILVTLGISNVVLQQPTAPRTERDFLDRSALTDVPYVLFVLGCVLTFLGLYTTFFYIATYAVEANVTSESMALYLVSILNGSSVFGRVLPNVPAITQRLGPLNMMVVSVFSLALVVLCFNAGPNMAGLVVMVIFYGFFVGAFFTLQPTIFERLTEDKSRSCRWGSDEELWILCMLGVERCQFGSGRDCDGYQ